MEGGRERGHIKKRRGCGQESEGLRGQDSHQSSYHPLPSFPERCLATRNTHARPRKQGHLPRRMRACASAVTERCSLMCWRHALSSSCSVVAAPTVMEPGATSTRRSSGTHSVATTTVLGLRLRKRAIELVAPPRTVACTRTEAAAGGGGSMAGQSGGAGRAGTRAWLGVCE